MAASSASAAPAPSAAPEGEARVGARATVGVWLEKVREELYGSVLPFWLRHSPDREFGGYFNCLDRDGRPFDTRKHVWLQGREAWMMARLANEASEEHVRAMMDRFVPARDAASEVADKSALAVPDASRTALVAVSKLGVDFLRKNAIHRENGHVYFALTRDGTPALIQRKPFSATFMIMAVAEFARAARDDALREEALRLVDLVLEWVRTPGALGRPVLEGETFSDSDQPLGYHPFTHSELSEPGDPGSLITPGDLGSDHPFTRSILSELCDPGSLITPGDLGSVYPFALALSPTSSLSTQTQRNPLSLLNLCVPHAPASRRGPEPESTERADDPAEHLHGVVSGPEPRGPGALLPLPARVVRGGDPEARAAGAQDGAGEHWRGREPRPLQPRRPPLQPGPRDRGRLVPPRLRTRVRRRSAQGHRTRGHRVVLRNRLGPRKGRRRPPLLC